MNVGIFARKAGQLTGSALAATLRWVTDTATPDLPVPPAGRALDLPGRGTTHVLDLPGPSPDSPTLLLMHGIATTGPLTWFSVLEDLQQQYRVVTFDQRWHGRGIRSEKFLLDDCADDAAAVLDALGIDRAIVIGYSMGGATAQVLWQRHPERVAGLVLCSTSARWEGHLGERVFFRTLKIVSDVVVTFIADKVQAHAEATPPPIDADAGLRAWAVGELKATSLWSLPVVMAELGKFDSSKWIADVSVPTGVLVTSQDKAIPTSRQLHLAELMPEAVMRYAPGGHTSLLFDLTHWKPVFLDLVQTIAERAAAADAAA